MSSQAKRRGASGGRTRKAVAMVAALLLAIVLWLLLRPSARVGPLLVRLEATRTWSLPHGKVRVRAVATLGSKGRPVPAAELSYAWETSGGVIRGAGEEIEWVAPFPEGTYEVAVVARRKGGATRRAGVVLEVRGRPGESLSEAAEKALGEYQMDVVLEKSKICANEDLRVDVKAADPNGESEWLVPIVQVPGAMARGFSTVLRIGAAFDLAEVWKEYDGQVTVELVDVRLKRVVATRRVSLQVEACQEPRAGLVVSCKWRQTKEGEADCLARVEDGQAFQPVRYEWIVVERDGTEVVKARGARDRAYVELPKRPQDRLVETYMVRARAYDASGQELTGRAYLERPNTRWQTAQEGGLLQLLPIFDSFPQPQGEVLVSHVEIENPFAEAVDLNEVSVTFFACGEKEGEGEGQEGKIEKQPIVSAASVFAVSRVEPLERIRYDWKLPADPKRCMAKAELKGVGVTSRLPAHAEWVMPTDPRMRAEMGPGEGEWMRAALSAMRKRTGKPVLRVTRQEIEDLEREGLIPSRAEFREAAKAKAKAQAEAEAAPAPNPEQGSAAEPAASPAAPHVH